MSRRALILLIIAAVAAGSAYVRHGSVDTESEQPGSTRSVSGSREASPERARQLNESPSLLQEPGVAVEPGSMQADLLGMTKANRDAIVRRTIIGYGFDCGTSMSAHAIGDTGTHWRANCGNGRTYWVVVDELGILRVSPMPYGDFDLPGIQRSDELPVIVRPEEGRSLELIEPRE